jgi:glycosyltransferase involved in cell wall biosynthesis
MAEKIKVLHVIKSLGRGGAERLLAETIALHSKTFQFDVVYFLPWKNQMVRELEAVGCRVYLLSARYTVLMLFHVPALTRLIRKNQYAVVHCHLPWAGIVGKLAGRLAHVPVVYTEHNNFFSYTSITRWLHKTGFTWFAMVIAVSADAETAIRKAMKRVPSLRTILNGVNTEKFNRGLYPLSTIKQELGLPPTSLIISTVAVFRTQKRLDRWLNIARQVIDRDRDVYFVIMGDGPEHGKLKEQVQSLQLTGHVLFTGLLEDPRPYLACTDIYLMSSDYEGLPVALLEAMSMECAPVVTGVGGIPGVVTHDQSGWLYAPAQEADAVQAILSLKANQTLRQSLAQAAREQVQQRFSMVRMVRELEEVYNQVKR